MPYKPSSITERQFTYIFKITRRYMARSEVVNMILRFHYEDIINIVLRFQKMYRCPSIPTNVLNSRFRTSDQSFFSCKKSSIVDPNLMTEPHPSASNNCNFFFQFATFHLNSNHRLFAKETAVAAK